MQIRALIAFTRRFHCQAPGETNLDLRANDIYVVIRAVPSSREQRYPRLPRRRSLYRTWCLDTRYQRRRAIEQESHVSAKSLSLFIKSKTTARGTLGHAIADRTVGTAAA